jgi:hypothetical protein
VRSGQITQRNQDGRVFKLIETVRVKVNFLIYYEIDEQTVKTVLDMNDYNGDEDSSWVLLEEVSSGAGPSGVQ